MSIYGGKHWQQQSTSLGYDIQIKGHCKIIEELGAKLPSTYATLLTCRRGEKIGERFFFFLIRQNNQLLASPCDLKSL